MGDLDQVPALCFWYGLVLWLQAFWKVNQQMEDSSLSLSFSRSLCLLPFKQIQMNIRKKYVHGSWNFLHQKFYFSEKILIWRVGDSLFKWLQMLGWARQKPGIPKLNQISPIWVAGTQPCESFPLSPKWHISRNLELEEVGLPPKYSSIRFGKPRVNWQNWSTNAD